MAKESANKTRHKIASKLKMLEERRKELTNNLSLITDENLRAKEI